MLIHLFFEMNFRIFLAKFQTSVEYLLELHQMYKLREITPLQLSFPSRNTTSLSTISSPLFIFLSEILWLLNIVSMHFLLNPCGGKVTFLFPVLQGNFTHTVSNWLLLTVRKNTDFFISTLSLAISFF